MMPSVTFNEGLHQVNMFSVRLSLILTKLLPCCGVSVFVFTPSATVCPFLKDTGVFSVSRD